MDTIDVPETCIQSPDDKLDVIKYTDALLTTLLSVDSAILQAEQRKNSPDKSKIVWELKKSNEDTSALVEILVDSKIFRIILARFGHHYMDGQLYNGYAQKFLRQRGHTHRCHFYMSNFGATGFWIRIYAFKN